MKKSQKGQSLFEVVLALGVITLVTVGIVILTSNAVKNATFSRNKNLASKLAQEATEWLRSERENNLTVFLTNTYSTATYCLDSNSINWNNIGSCGSSELVNAIFKREVSFTRSLVNSKTLIQADIKVSWNDSLGYHESRSVTNFTDIREQ